MPTERTPAPSVFAQPETAYMAMRDFVTRCDGRNGRCKSCAFLLKALDEIDALRAHVQAIHSGYENVTY